MASSSSLICPSLQVLKPAIVYNTPTCTWSRQRVPLNLPSLSFPATGGNSTCRRRRSTSSLRRSRGGMAAPRAEAATVTIERGGVKIVRNPPESKLGVRNWPKWGCPPSKFPWTYSAKETCYILEGKVKVYPDGSDEVVEVGAGDLVVFPKGMSCTWDVSVGIDKHYNFE